MRTNIAPISGVVHQRQHSNQYRLRRYFPSPDLRSLVEQFWFVDWDLPEQTPHLQKNLPDPNFHLIVENQWGKILGPVSKAYEYEMRGSGSILGVKFVVASLPPYLASLPGDFVDREVAIDAILNIDARALFVELQNTVSDKQKVKVFERHLRPFASPPTQHQKTASELVELIKTTSDLITVNQLTEQTGIQIRALQRIFKQYVGLNPKLLIRKYRLHQAVALLDNHEKDFADVVSGLGYSDQSHLIRDFKDMLGITPNQYTVISDDESNTSV